MSEERVPSRVQARDEPCQDPARCDVHGNEPEASPENPVYRKQRQDDDKASRMATKLFMIIVDEGWRTWILCTDMYEWAADGLLAILKESDATWPR